MTRLTEEMVIARSRQSDLASIKKLNCWGSDLSDVSIIKRMRGVEVLALSVNKITGLQDFEDCQQLQELYLRKNNIQDLNEIAYLQNLPDLRYLWLEENPCCSNVGPNYRSIVLRALPNLKKLDNVEVTPEEVQEAQKLTMVRDEEVYEDAREQANQQQQQQQQQQPQRRSQSPVKEPIQASRENIEETFSEPLNVSPVLPSSPQQRTPPSQDYSPPEQIHPTSPKYQNNNNKDPRISYPQYDRSPGSEHESPVSGGNGGGGGGVGGGGSNSGGGGGYRERGPIPPSISTHSMKEYYQSDYPKPVHPAHYRHSQCDLTEWDEHQHPSQYNGSGGHHGGPPQRRSAGTEREMHERYGYRNGNGNGRERDEWEDNDRPKRRQDGRMSDTASVVSTAVLNHYAGYHRRPVNRSSNLLSATLCLVKELDYPSLEVVEHAVRCRIDELSAE